MNYPPPQPQPPLQPLKKKGSGCLLFVGIAGVGLVIVGIIIMVIAWKFASSPAGQTAIGASKAAMDGMNAPGTKELRAAGCAQAMVIDAARIEALAKQFADASAEPKAPGYGLQVMCITKQREGTPTCQQVSEAYRAAVTKAAAPYMVTVTVQGTPRPDCTVIYNEEGLRIRGE